MSTMSFLKEIKTVEEWKEYESTRSPSTLQVIYFKAQWVESCKHITTVIETLAQSYPITEPLTTSWISVDAEELLEVSDLFNVTAVPYVLIRRGTAIVDGVTGSDTSKIRAMIERILEPSQALSDKVIDSNGQSKESLGSSSNELTVPNSEQKSGTIIDEVKKVAREEDKKATKEELHNRLAKLVKAAPIMLFMKGTPASPECGFSRQIVSIIRQSGVKYGFFNILADEDVRQGLKEYADWPTYPQLWMNGELIGGLDIVKEELENNPDFFKSIDITSAGTNK